MPRSILMNSMLLSPCPKNRSASMEQTTSLLMVTGNPKRRSSMPLRSRSRHPNTVDSRMTPSSTTPVAAMPMPMIVSASMSVRSWSTSCTIMSALMSLSGPSAISMRCCGVPSRSVTAPCTRCSWDRSTLMMCRRDVSMLSSVPRLPLLEALTSKPLSQISPSSSMLLATPDIATRESPVCRPRSARDSCPFGNSSPNTRERLLRRTSAGLAFVVLPGVCRGNEMVLAYEVIGSVVSCQSAHDSDHASCGVVMFKSTVFIL